MQHSTQGIVLTTTRYKDNAYIANIFTKDFGKVSYAVYNPQSKRAKIKLQHLQPMSIVDIEVTHRENKDIQQLSEAKLHPLSYQLYDHPGKISICFFLAEIIQRSIETTNVDVDLYQFITHSLETLVQSKEIQAFPLAFLLDFSKYIGIYPYDEVENEVIKLLSNEDKELFSKLLQQPQGLTLGERRRSMQLIIDYYKHYLPGMGEIKSLSVLTELFSA
ncbi:MAG: DNA repair protein RecO [Paludibacteraceae bacterium]|nr:DNA repair protein RecO [Paludibacteraceae bacterium]